MQNHTPAISFRSHSLSAIRVRHSKLSSAGLRWFENVLGISLTHSQWLVIVYLSSLIHAGEPTRALRVKQSTIATACGRSLRTINTAIQGLVRHGLINPLSQPRRTARSAHYGTVLDIAPIRLSHVFLTAFFSQSLCATVARSNNQISVSSSNKENSASPASPSKQDICVDNRTRAQQLVDAEAGIEWRNGVLHDPAGLRLNADRPHANLRFCQLSFRAICSLMRLARQQHQSLDVIIKALMSRKAFPNLSGRPLFAYLSTLIRSGNDFTRHIRTAMAEAKPALQRDISEQQLVLDASLKRLRGKGRHPLPADAAYPDIREFEVRSDMSVALFTTGQSTPHSVITHPSTRGRSRLIQAICETTPAVGISVQIAPTTLPEIIAAPETVKSTLASARAAIRKARSLNSHG
ncbi:helix-turn-helix domain-containing protein [Laribacter hongkongensis]|uniref:helix-turn-helix domain-containing protein n=1 Tax=Laribacter hongkongensis TaxID=168471 RepID=UPI001EFD68B5|nr:helix-turn-helix domain-containing protein [Laribacter hongkongensis]MCG9084092.1 helix-turn-helix domain-containing protein [Laribacter hongkongensis]